MPRCDCREAARRLAEMGFSTADIARVFAVSPRTVRYWLRGGRPAAVAEPRREPPRPNPLLDNQWVKILRSRQT